MTSAKEKLQALLNKRVKVVLCLSSSDDMETTNAAAFEGSADA